jgi:hypothetical protein
MAKRKSSFFKFANHSALFLGFVLFCGQALAMPAQIAIIRHAEKPSSGSELSARGWERAKALPSLFLESRFLTFGSAVAVFGMSPSQSEGSVRSIQTVQYLSQSLGLVTNTGFTGDDVDQLAREIKTNKIYDGKLVVICWHHQGIQDVAVALGVQNAPSWSGSDFDRVWLLTFKSDQELQFENLPQRLLSGDSQN